MTEFCPKHLRETHSRPLIYGYFLFLCNNAKISFRVIQIPIVPVTVRPLYNNASVVQALSFRSHTVMMLWQVYISSDLLKNLTTSAVDLGRGLSVRKMLKSPDYVLLSVQRWSVSCELLTLSFVARFSVTLRLLFAYFKDSLVVTCRGKSPLRFPLVLWYTWRCPCFVLFLFPFCVLSMMWISVVSVPDHWYSIL